MNSSSDRVDTIGETSGTRKSKSTAGRLCETTVHITLSIWEPSTPSGRRRRSTTKRLLSSMETVPVSTSRSKHPSYPYKHIQTPLRRILLPLHHVNYPCSRIRISTCHTPHPLFSSMKRRPPSFYYRRKSPKRGFARIASISSRIFHSPVCCGDVYQKHATYKVHYTAYSWVTPEFVVAIE